MSRKQFEKYWQRGREGLRAALLEIKTGEDARAFIIAYAQALDPQVADTSFEKSLESARNSLGYMTGDDVPLEIREFWYKEAAVRHPFVPDLAHRDVTPQEMYEAGLRLGEEMRRQAEAHSTKH